MATKFQDLASLQQKWVKSNTIKVLGLHKTNIQNQNECPAPMSSQAIPLPEVYDQQKLFSTWDKLKPSRVEFNDLYDT